MYNNVLLFAFIVSLLSEGAETPDRNSNCNMPVFSSWCIQPLRGRVRDKIPLLLLKVFHGYDSKDLFAILLVVTVFSQQSVDGADLSGNGLTSQVNYWFSYCLKYFESECNHALWQEIGCLLEHFLSLCVGGGGGRMCVCVGVGGLCEFNVFNCLDDTIGKAFLLWPKVHEEPDWWYVSHLIRSNYFSFMWSHSDCLWGFFWPQPMAQDHMVLDHKDLMVLDHS